MKKSMLQAMQALTASQEMKEVAMADEPKKETTYYGHTYTTRTYFAFMNCLVQDGVLKAAFFLPDHLRLDGNNPVYELFLDKENRQFLTYDHLEKKWRDAKLDRLEWPGRNYYATCWVIEEDEALVQDYFSGERGGDLGILDFQRNVRDLLCALRRLAPIESLYPVWRHLSLSISSIRPPRTVWAIPLSPG